MLFEKFEDFGLSHFSYAIGCPKAGKMVVIDPSRRIEDYLSYATKHSVVISDILDTHIHADYASGSLELQNATGATLWQSGYDEGETFQVHFPHRDIYQGDSIQIGAIRIQARHTPGHTPEHLSLVVYDGNRSEQRPMMMLSGDFLFVGSIGRPDLLGEDAKTELAFKLYESLNNLTDLPGSLEIYPAHGSGSMCGADISGRPLSTLGYERATNPYLSFALNSAKSAQEFVDLVLDNVPPFPEYYKRMKKINAQGPDLLGQSPDIPAIKAPEFKKLSQSGYIIVDLRDGVSFGQGHIRQSFGIGQKPSLATWASWFVPYDTPLLLINETTDDIEQAFYSLASVGLDKVAGYLEGGIAAWNEDGFELEQSEFTSVSDLHTSLQSSHTAVIDIRTDAEWESGHITGAVHIPIHQIENSLHLLPEEPFYVVCGSGYRSTVATSLLLRANQTNHINVIGGMSAWLNAGLPTTSQHQAAHGHSLLVDPVGS